MRRAGALEALVTTAMEAGKLRQAAAAVTRTQSWCAQFRQWLKQGDSWNGGSRGSRRRQRCWDSGFRWGGGGGGGECEVAI